MVAVRFVLMVLALICFILAAVGFPTGKINMIGLGLALWVASLLYPFPK